MRSGFIQIIRRSLIRTVQSPVSAINAHVQHHIGDVPFFFLLATTFLPLARLFNSLSHFLFPGATFFHWRGFFILAQLFFGGATTLLEFIASSNYEHVWVSKMADPANNNLVKVSSISFCSEYCRFRERIERMNRRKVASFVFSLFSVLTV